MFQIISRVSLAFLCSNKNIAFSATTVERVLSKFMCRFIHTTCILCIVFTTSKAVRVLHVHKYNINIIYIYIKVYVVYRKSSGFFDFISKFELFFEYHRYVKVFTDKNENKPVQDVGFIKYSNNNSPFPFWIFFLLCFPLLKTITWWS